MNERIKELAEQARKYARDYVAECKQYGHYMEHNEYELRFEEKFALLIVEDAVNIMKQEWYGWNNAPKVENETPRDIGMRVGAKSQTIRLIHLIKKHFGVKDDYED
jgi:hypothetical protein